MRRDNSLESKYFTEEKVNYWRKQFLLQRSAENRRVQLPGKYTLQLVKRVDIASLSLFSLTQYCGNFLFWFWFLLSEPEEAAVNIKFIFV